MNLVDSNTVKVVQDNDNISLEANIVQQGTAPANPVAKDLWIDTTTNELKLYNGVNWVIVGYKNNYSTNETTIGTWIDGKPVYRKVIDLGALPNANAKYVPHNISNLETIINLTGMAYNSTNKNRVILPYVNSTVQYIVQMFANNTDIVLVSGYDQSGFDECFAIIEYTKTTD